MGFDVELCSGHLAGSNPAAVDSGARSRTSIISK